MKRLIIILSICFSTSSFAQNPDKENFINAVYKVAVDTTFPYYILYNDAFPFNKYEKDTLIKNLNHILPDSVIRQLFENASVDTLYQIWDCNKLSKVQCVTKASIEQIVGVSLLKTPAPSVYAKTKRKTRKEEKQLTKQYEQREKKPLYEKRVYYFSRPVFDNKNEYAMIGMGYGCGSRCGLGCKYFFKLNNGEWTLITSMQCWVS